MTYLLIRSSSTVVSSILLLRQYEDKRSVELIKDDGLNNEVAPLDDFYDVHLLNLSLVQVVTLL